MLILLFRLSSDDIMGQLQCDNDVIRHEAKDPKDIIFDEKFDG